jgi:class 3 adenylate cyclase
VKEQPPTQYAEGPGGYVAYQVWGSGSVDVLLIPPWAWNIEVMWEQPRIEHYLRRLGRFSRVIAYDKLGTGVSDPVPLGALPTLEQWSDDVRVVLDAATSPRAAVVGNLEGGQMALLFAALHPERTHAVVVLDGAACYLRHDDYPAGLPRPLMQAAEEVIFGRGADRVALVAPSLVADAHFQDWFARFERLALCPSAKEHMSRHGMQWDVRAALPAISAPTLVVHHADARYIRTTAGRYIAEHIAGARYLELPGGDSIFYAGDQDAALGEIESFLTGVRTEPEHDRVLATVLFTDLVGSTEHAARVGDSRWRHLLDTHDLLATEQVSRFRGRLIKTTGDGVLATFDGPGRAIRCAAAIDESIRTLGLQVRAGLHVGEVELRGDDIGGIAVNTAARIMGEAASGEILVSNVVKDLVVGSGLEFLDRGEWELRGVPGRWRLFAYRS